MAVRPALNLRVADRLLDDGLITRGDHRRAVEYARARNRRIEEALLELDVIEEVEFLRFLAKMHRTQFVSTERMSKAKLDRAALRMVPKKLAELYGLFPLLFDPNSQRLVVATADPDNVSALDDLRAATQAGDIRALVARPAAVAAAVARGYDGDKYAFTNLLRQIDSLGTLQLGEAYRQQAATGDVPTAAKRPRAVAEQPRRERSVFRGSPERADRAEARAPRAPTPQAEPPPAEEVRAPPAPRPRRALPEEEPAPVAVRTPTPAARPAPAAMRSPTPAARPAPGVVRSPTPAARPAQPPPRAPARTPAKRPPELSSTLRSRRGDELIAGDQLVGGEPTPEPPAELDERAGPGDFSPVDRRSAELDDPFDHHPSGLPVVEPLTSEELAPPAAPLVEEIDPEDLVSQRSIPPPPSRVNLGLLSRRSDRPPPLSSQAGYAQLVEAFRVLVGLLENERPDLRGHSSIVARLVQDACERIGLSTGHTTALVIAAHLHDLGKRGGVAGGRRREADHGPVHITSLNVAHLPAVKELARKLVGLPAELMEGVGLPEQTKAALATMYEHIDGGGVPHGIPGGDIPIGGRILAVADTYADLIHNPRNTYDKVLSPQEAMGVLGEHAGSVFDPNIVEVFGHAMTGEQILGQLLDERHRVLIIDPDPEQTLVLQLRLSDQGFEVHLARDTEEARAALMSRKFALVVCEIDLEEPDAGLFLREEVAKMESGRDLSWVFLSARSSRNTLKRAFDLGVDDFISKPAAVEIVVAKLVQLVEREESAKPAAPRGVSGSLSDMAMTDIVQILFHGQRTCSLLIEWPDTKGEVHFRDGRIVNALVGDMEGENAFYRMLSLGEDGQFRVDPSFEPEGEPKIMASPEALLLEGMRLLDEGLVP